MFRWLTCKIDLSKDATRQVLVGVLLTKERFSLETIDLSNAFLLEPDPETKEILRIIIISNSHFNRYT